MNSRFPVFTAGIYDPAGVGGFGNVICNDFILSSINTLIFFEPDFSFYLFCFAWTSFIHHSHWCSCLGCEAVDRVWSF